MRLNCCIKGIKLFEKVTVFPFKENYMKKTLSCYDKKQKCQTVKHFFKQKIKCILISYFIHVILSNFLHAIKNVNVDFNS